LSAILLDSSIVHYEVLGRGRPVIFLHGWVGSWKYWIASMQVTSTSYRAYALDLWGFGDTAHSALNYSLEQQSTLLERFLNEMGIGKIALVGHGLGALVGMKFTASMVGLQADNLYGSFRNLNIPCLLVYGERDQAVLAPDESFSLSSMTHPVFLEGSGHFPMIDETIRFNRLLTDFLALDSGVSPSELQMKEEWKRRVR
jgi:pimeloyl-ACP methyl ester carboxylesterase